MINFLRFKYLYFAFSATLLILSLVGLVLFGLKPGVDFTGGALLELGYTQGTNLSAQDIQDRLSQITPISSVQPVDQGWLIKATELDNTQRQQIIDDLSTDHLEVVEVRFETVGPILGQELLRKTIIAIILGSVLIMLYIGYQFKEFNYGVSAILAVVHDVVIVLGSFAWLGRFMGVEVDSLFVTALLTTLSFSVHDTIVVFDRIRENLRVGGKSEFNDTVNLAITETLGRSLNNSMTIIFMLVALVLLGGESIRWFVVALLIGTVIGTYSSTFTAAPLLTLLHQYLKKRSK